MAPPENGVWQARVSPRENGGRRGSHVAVSGLTALDPDAAPLSARAVRRYAEDCVECATAGAVLRCSVACDRIHRSNRAAAVGFVGGYLGA